MWHSARSFDADVVFALFPFEAEQNGQLLEPLTVVDTSTAVLKPLQPPAPALVLPAPTRKYWSGWFEFASGPFGPGNALLAVRNIAGALDRPVIVSSETEHMVSGTLLGRFIGGSSVEEIEAAAKASQLRPVAYWDANAWPRWPALPKGSWLCVRLYCDAGTSPEAFKAEGQAAIQAAPQGVPVMLVGQQYSSNAALVGYVDPSTPPPQDSAALKPLASALVELANANANVIALYLFSGYGRRGGLMDHPDLVQPWADFAAQLQAPPLEAYPPDPPIPPKPVEYYNQHKENPMSDNKTVTCGGPQGKLARIDPSEAGKGPFGWYPIHWDGTDPSDPNCQWDQSKPDAKFLLAHKTTGAMLGADPTLYGADPLHPFDISKQFYGKPKDHPDGRGAYESPCIYEGNLNKTLQGVVEFTTAEGGFDGFSAAFAVVPVA